MTGAFILIIGIAVILHEVAHGYAASLLGDPTARDQGRLTLNPIPHIDLIGTIIIPAFLIITNAGILFGWAKPVPYNPYNLRGRFGEALVAAAGPATNIALALLFALLFRLFADASAVPLFSMAVGINLFLAFLNLIPVPPLDGSKIVSAFLPMQTRLRFEEKVAEVGSNPIFLILVLLGIVFFLAQPLATLVWFITQRFLGV
ncbi:MAG: site-2 protease family protein [Candidatus Kaiserbacteria bacterium]|nr:site-2 protease family protein [Candidatus Kaiserbacteria bacterium]